MIRFKTKVTGPLFDGKAVGIMRREYRKALMANLINVEMAVARITPAGVTGLLRMGIKGKILSDIRGVVASSGPSSKYAPIVEHGRGPGKFPPPDAISLWLKRTAKGKVFVQAIQTRYGIKNESTALKAATYLKSRGIAKQGTPAQKMFAKTECKMRKSIIAKFNAASKKIERLLSDK